MYSHFVIMDIHFEVNFDSDTCIIYYFKSLKLDMSCNNDKDLFAVVMKYESKNVSNKEIRDIAILSDECALGMDKNVLC